MHLFHVNGNAKKWLLLLLNGKQYARQKNGSTQYARPKYGGTQYARGEGGVTLMTTTYVLLNNKKVIAIYALS